MPELGELVKRALDGRGPFKPFAIYDEGLRLVHVLVRDCSNNEKSFYGVMDLLEGNYTDEGQSRWVGFNIYASRGFMIREGLCIAGRVNLNSLLNEVERRYPRLKEQVGICRQVLGDLPETTVKLW